MTNDKNSVFQIPEGVNSISNSKIFKGKENDIKVLVIHDKVEKINSKCLCTLKNLEKIEVAENNKYFSVIGGVLYNKKNNTLVKLPPKSEVSEVNISYGLVPFAFDGCRNLKKVNMDKGRWSIPESAFAECEGLECVEFDEGVSLMAISAGAFEGCKSLKRLVLPKDTDYIADDALKGCELETLVLPDDIYDNKDNKEQIRKIFGFGSVDKLKTIDIKKASKYLEEQRSSASNVLKSAGTENASKKINSNDNILSSDKENPSKMVEVPDNGMEKQVASNRNYDNIKIEIPKNDNVLKLEKQLAEKGSEKQNAMTVNNPANAAAISTADSNIQSLMKMFEQEMASKQTIDIKDVKIMLLTQQIENQRLRQEAENQRLRQEAENQKQQLKIQELQHQLEMQKRDKESKIASLENEISQLKREIKQKDNQIATLSNANSGLKEKNKEISKQMSRYVSQHDSINPNYFYDLHKKTGEKIRYDFYMIETSIYMANETSASFYLRLSAEYCLSEICSLYDIHTGKKATLEQMIELSEEVFKNHNMENSFNIFRGISERTNPICHSEKGEYILMDRSFSCEEAQILYNLLKGFYNSDFVTLCKQSNKLNDLSTKISKTETNNSKTELNFCDSQILNNQPTLNQELQSESSAGETIHKASDNAKGGEINKIEQQQEAKQKIDSKQLFEDINNNINDTCENGSSYKNVNKNDNDVSDNVADEIDQENFASDAKASSSMVASSASESGNKPSSENNHEPSDKDRDKPSNKNNNELSNENRNRPDSENRNKPRYKGNNKSSSKKTTGSKTKAANKKDNGKNLNNK